jgi:hypothetical protein
MHRVNKIKLIRVRSETGEIIGYNDAHPHSSAGTVFVAFDRESASLETAIKTAIADLKSGGFEIERIELAESDLAIGVA